MHDIADFRSDTVTRPTPAMRQAMAEAEVGDDVLGDDPTVKRLEEMAAELLGKEAGLFVPSGTMGNAVSLGSQVAPGEEMIAEEWAHCLNFEAGGAAGLFGILTRTLRSHRGAMDPEELARWIRPGSLHTPRTAMVAVENSHNFHGGAVLPLENLKAIRELCLSRGVLTHMDGARIWNATAASGVPLAEYGGLCDSISVCLSKGLRAPVGSVVLGTRAMIDRARVFRKRLGGAMRQVGVIAAAGIVALSEMRSRIGQDHENARALAEGMARLPGIELDPAVVETNIIFVKVTAMEAAKFEEILRAEKIWMLATGDDQCRFVLHADVDREDVDRALAVMADVLGD